jgi:hypothetical protein
MVHHEESADRPESYDPLAPMKEDPRRDYPRTPTRDTGMSGQQSTTQQVQNAADAAKAKGQEMMDRTQQQADAQREQAADRLGDVADTVREKQDQLPGGQTTQRVATTVADKMDQASVYLRQNDVSDITNDLQAFARAHPAESLVAAAALGFVIGRALRS